MADRWTEADATGHAGCRHVLEPQVRAALRSALTTPLPAQAVGVTVLQLLRNRLQADVPTVTWTADTVRKALRNLFEDE